MVPIWMIHSSIITMFGCQLMTRTNDSTMLKMNHSCAVRMRTMLHSATYDFNHVHRFLYMYGGEQLMIINDLGVR